MLFNLKDYLQLLFISCDLKQLKNKSIGVESFVPRHLIRHFFFFGSAGSQLQHQDLSGWCSARAIVVVLKLS